MGFGDNFKKWLNGEADAVDVDRDDVNDMEENDMANEINYNQSNMSIDGAIELKVVKPERFESVSQIADHLLSRRTVVLNLENTNKETARRLIDFLSGVAYSINGQLKKIASNAYVITPENVDVSGEQLRERAVEQAPVVQDQPADSNEETSF